MRATAFATLFVRARSLHAAQGEQQLCALRLTRLNGELSQCHQGEHGVRAVCTEQARACAHADILQVQVQAVPPCFSLTMCVISWHGCALEQSCELRIKHHLHAQCPARVGGWPIVLRNMTSGPSA